MIFFKKFILKSEGDVTMDSYLIGIDVGGTNIKMLIMDTSLRPLEKCSIPTNAPEGYENISARMIHAMYSMFAKHNYYE